MGTVRSFSRELLSTLPFVVLFAAAYPPREATAGGCDVLSIAAGTRHTLVLRSDGSVWASGANGWGQLGNSDATLADQDQPVQVFSDAIAIAAGGWHSVVLGSDGTVWTFGSNAFGELGNFAVNTGLGKRLSVSPVRVTDAAGSDLTEITAIAAGSHHCLALKSDGTRL